MEDSIFTKIIKGEIPSHKIYEDDKTIAFLTIQPVREGHTLVVPKIQVDQYIDLPDDYYDAMWRTVKKVAARIREQTGKERIGVVIKGIDVPHTHVHLIPFDNGESLKADGVLEIVSPETLAPIAEKLRF
jgi:histidine triad (HIT) family protein